MHTSELLDHSPSTTSSIFLHWAPRHSARSSRRLAAAVWKPVFGYPAGRDGRDTLSQEDGRPWGRMASRTHRGRLELHEAASPLRVSALIVKGNYQAMDEITLASDKRRRDEAAIRTDDDTARDGGKAQTTRRHAVLGIHVHHCERQLRGPC